MKYILALFFTLGISPAFGANCPPLPNYITEPCVIVAGDASYQLGNNIDGTAGGHAPVISIAPGLGRIRISCNGYRIENNSPWGYTSAGIRGTLVADVSINYCAFAGSGLETCIDINNGGSGRAFKTILIETTTCNATSAGFFINSDIVTLRNNYVVNVGGSRNCMQGYRTFGIWITGGTVTVNDNRIQRVWNHCFVEAVGIAFADLNTNVEMKRNVIENDRVPTSSWIAVWMGSNSGPYVIEDNEVNMWYYAFIGYPPIVGGNVFKGTAKIRNINSPSMPPIDAYPTLWTVTP